jgi:hypothetical protein
MKKGWTNYFGERGDFVGENAGLDKLEGPSHSITHHLAGRLQPVGEGIVQRLLLLCRFLIVL